MLLSAGCMTSHQNLDSAAVSKTRRAQNTLLKSRLQSCSQTDVATKHSYFTIYKRQLYQIGMILLGSLLYEEEYKTKRTYCRLTSVFPLSTKHFYTEGSECRYKQRAFKWGLSVNKWSDVEWTDVVYVKWSCVELKWNEVIYGEVLGDKSTMHISVTVYWGYLVVLWLFHLVCILYCGCCNLFCGVWVCVCVGVVMCGCVYVWVL